MGIDKLIEEIIAEEFGLTPAIRTAKRLITLGITETEVLILDIEDVIRVKVANALRSELQKKIKRE